MMMMMMIFVLIVLFESNLRVSDHHRTILEYLFVPVTCFSSLFSRTQIDLLVVEFVSQKGGEIFWRVKVLSSSALFRFLFQRERRRRELFSVLWDGGTFNEPLSFTLSLTLVSLHKTKQNSIWANSNRIAADLRASLKTTSRRRYQSPRSISADTLRSNR